ncbi:MAG: Hsp20/alpha crystallin family protein [Candidatus Iainarchaeum archaeon]|uniref:Hsp20/alpha crystallin family protein n=1 Tax=Candidatus Iainarchaeum sp. TaxID=3101447 RepID=A0A497JGB8_9ARCH|nr:MAG: Hsp20/alpha crystallin family protein [Candidatus Diapherotrites archaeon]
MFDPWRRRRFFRRFWEDFFSGFEFPKIEFPSAEIREPLIDVVDEGNKLRVVAELPGVKKKDLHINVLPNAVEISAKVTEKEEKEEEGYYFRERSYSQFYRRIPLPAEVIPEKTQAKFENGILELVLEKKETKKGFEVKL